MAAPSPWRPGLASHRDFHADVSDTGSRGAWEAPSRASLTALSASARRARVQRPNAYTDSYRAGAGADELLRRHRGSHRAETKEYAPLSGARAPRVSFGSTARVGAVEAWASAEASWRARAAAASTLDESQHGGGGGGAAAAPTTSRGPHDVSASFASTSAVLRDADGAADTVEEALNSDNIRLGGRQLGTFAVMELVSHHEAFAKCRELDLSSNDLWDRAATALADALSYNESITCVDLSRNNLAAGGCAALAAFVGSSNSLQTLKLRANRVGNAGATALARAITSRESALQHLDVAANFIREEGVAELASALTSGTAASLTSLDLSLNLLQAAGADALGGVLRMNRSLRKLCLNSCALKTEGAVRLASSLVGNATLTHLELADNFLSAEAAVAFARILEHDTCAALVSLNLSGAMPDPESDRKDAESEPASRTGGEAAAGADSSRVDSTGGGLDTSATSSAKFHRTTGRFVTTAGDMGIGDAGAIALARALAINHVLKHLDLSSNCITASGAETMAELLLRNSTLNTLALAFNVRVAAQGGAALLRCAREHASLMEIDCTDCGLDDATLSELQKATSANRSRLELARLKETAEAAAKSADAAEGTLRGDVEEFAVKISAAETATTQIVHRSAAEAEAIAKAEDDAREAETRATEARQRIAALAEARASLEKEFHSKQAEVEEAESRRMGLGTKLSLASARAAAAKGAAEEAEARRARLEKEVEATTKRLADARARLQRTATEVEVATASIEKLDEATQAHHEAIGKAEGAAVALQTELHALTVKADAAEESATVSEERIAGLRRALAAAESRHAEHSARAEAAGREARELTEARDAAQRRVAAAESRAAAAKEEDVRERLREAEQRAAEAYRRLAAAVEALGVVRGESEAASSDAVAAEAREREVRRIVNELLGKTVATVDDTELLERQLQNLELLQALQGVRRPRVEPGTPGTVSIGGGMAMRAAGADGDADGGAGGAASADTSPHTASQGTSGAHSATRGAAAASSPGKGDVGGRSPAGVIALTSPLSPGTKGAEAATTRPQQRGSPPAADDGTMRVLDMEDENLFDSSIAVADAAPRSPAARRVEFADGSPHKSRPPVTASVARVDEASGAPASPGASSARARHDMDALALARAAADRLKRGAPAEQDDVVGAAAPRSNSDAKAEARFAAAAAGGGEPAEITRLRSLLMQGAVFHVKPVGTKKWSADTFVWIDVRSARLKWAKGNSKPLDRRRYADAVAGDWDENAGLAGLAQVQEVTRGPPTAYPRGVFASRKKIEAQLAPVCFTVTLPRHGVSVDFKAADGDAAADWSAGVEWAAAAAASGDGSLSPLPTTIKDSGGANKGFGPEGVPPPPSSTPPAGAVKARGAVASTQSLGPAPWDRDADARGAAAQEPSTSLRPSDASGGAAREQGAPEGAARRAEQDERERRRRARAEAEARAEAQRARDEAEAEAARRRQAEAERRRREAEAEAAAEEEARRRAEEAAAEPPAGGPGVPLEVGQPAPPHASDADLMVVQQLLWEHLSALPPDANLPTYGQLREDVAARVQQRGGPELKGKAWRRWFRSQVDAQLQRLGELEEEEEQAVDGERSPSPEPGDMVTEFDRASPSPGAERRSSMPAYMRGHSPEFDA